MFYKCIHFKIMTKTHDAGKYHKVHLTLSQKYFNKFQIFYVLFLEYSIRIIHYNVCGIMNFHRLRDKTPVLGRESWLRGEISLSHTRVHDE